MSKKELQKAIVQSQQNYKDIVFGNVSRIYEECLKEFQEHGKIAECIYQEM